MNYKKAVASARFGLKRIKKEKFVSFCQDLKKDSNSSFGKKLNVFKIDGILEGMKINTMMIKLNRLIKKLMNYALYGSRWVLKFFLIQLGTTSLIFHFLIWNWNWLLQVSI